ncbi:MAG: hypothetical protein ACRCV0_04205 [Brevinema sp.]
MNYSDTVFMKNKDIIDAIIGDPFVTKLVDGSLDKKIFDYYIIQDTIYLEKFCQVAALCASKAAPEDVSFFITMQESCQIEIKNINQHYTLASDFIHTDGRTSANLHYTSFLYEMCHQHPIEVAFAGLYPCPWLYMYIGQLFGQDVPNDHPYRHWLISNGNPEYPKIIKTYENLLNKFANQSPHLQEKMYHVARIAFFHERYFWRDAYYLENFDQLLYPL